MFLNERVLALWLGLFFCFLLSLAAQEEVQVSFNTGTLWVDDSGPSGFWQLGVSLDIKNFHFGLKTGQVLSGLPIIDGSVFCTSGEAGFILPLFGPDYLLSNSQAGINLKTGILDQSSLTSVVKNSESIIKLTNQGGNGFFIGIDTPLNLNNFAIKPSFLYGKGKWQDGDLYKFLGKPDMPSFCIYGLSLEYQNFISHELSYSLLNMDFNLINKSDKLYTSNLKLNVLYYKAKLDYNDSNYSVMAGWLCADAELNGELNMQNQPYFLFPYRFYNMDAGFKAHALFAIFNVTQKWGFFGINIDLGAAHIFYDDNYIDIHYQEKRLFGNKEIFETNTLDLKGIGAAFISLNLFFDIPVFKNHIFTIGLNKLFGIPWGNKQINYTNESNSASLLKSALLSGFSINGTLKF